MVDTQRGYATPLGVSKRPEGTNFALFSQHAKHVVLCLFHPGESAPFKEICLDSKNNRTGQIWHALVTDLPEPCEYAYRVDEKKYLIDPYARSLSPSTSWGKKEDFNTLHGKVLSQVEFDWQEDHPPKIPMEQLIIYEMHVRGFTQDPSSGVAAKGTFSGIVDKIPYLKELGVNAIELLPTFLFNEKDNAHDPNLFNFWGYASLSYFALMSRYASDPSWGGEIKEFKTMVSALHRAGIEVILDVVYNHTGENDAAHPAISWRGIDNSVYYMLSKEGQPLDFTGCGNTVNCNHPVTMRMILDSLRYCVSELHIDGFRFDLASIFYRTSGGKVAVNPPILAAIQEDPLLSQTKLIAEAWDAAGLYQVGSFGGAHWAEWNGQYRDVVRRFIKGTNGQSGRFASCICGSEDLYGKGRAPYHSINFITAHDGFTLRDLVSYNEKHNEENGEQGRDGMSQNDSWNCGAEGPTTDENVNQLRARQMRNFMLALFTSIGTPMMLMSDEYGHTRDGNNNPYSLDNEKNYFLWDKQDAPFSRFVKLIIGWRKRLKLLQKTHFLSSHDVTWHGTKVNQPDWGDANRLVAYTLQNSEGCALYIAYNAFAEPVEVELPFPPCCTKWKRVVDTNLPSPDDITDSPQPIESATYTLAPYSAIMLISFILEE